MLELLIQNWNQFCKEDNFVGIGATRKVYKVSDYVIKVHLHPVGYKQSVNELKIYTSMQKKGLDALLAQTYYVDNYISIQKYYTPLELKNNQSYEINAEEHSYLIPNLFGKVLKELDSEFDCFDLEDSSNFGLDSNYKLIFIDYGMTKSLYEKGWVPLAEKGRLPQIYFDFCNICKMKKELRMYGDEDKDRRCYECGKE